MEDLKNPFTNPDYLANLMQLEMKLLNGNHSQETIEELVGIYTVNFLISNLLNCIITRKIP